MTEELCWADVEKELKNLVKFVSKFYYQQKVHVDPSITPDDLFQIGMLKLFDCYMKYKHLDMEEFKKVTKVALYREVKGNCKTTINESLDSKTDDKKEIPTETEFSNKELSKNIQTLHNSLKRETSKNVLKELLNPSQRTIDIMLKDIEEKQAEAQQGKKVRVPKGTEIKKWHIRESLGLTQKQFDKALKEVRDKAFEIFEVENSFLK